MPNSVGPRRVFWYVLVAVIVVDVITKAIAVAHLTRFPLPIVGDLVTFQLVYNTGAAFGIHIGPMSRLVFGTLAVQHIDHEHSARSHPLTSESHKLP